MSDDTHLQTEMHRAKAEFWRQPEAALQLAAAAISAAASSKSARALNKRVGTLREQAAQMAGSMTQQDAFQLTEELKQAILNSPVMELRAAYQDYLGMVSRLLQASLKRDAAPGDSPPFVDGQPTPSTKLGVAHVGVVGALSAQYAKGFDEALKSIELPIVVFTESQGRFGPNTLEAVRLKAYWLRGLNRYEAVTSFLNGLYTAADASTLAQSDAGAAVGASMAWAAFAHEHDLEKARQIAVCVADRMRDRAARADASLAVRLHLAEVLVAASSAGEPGPHDHRPERLQEAEAILRDQHRAVVLEQGRRSDTARVFHDRLQLVRMLLDNPVDESLWADVWRYLAEESPRGSRDLSEPALRCDPVPQSQADGGS